MTDFVSFSALPVILVQPTCVGDQRAKGVQFQSTCSLCRESHKTQVWLCFLALSVLSTYTCAASVPRTKHVQTCLTELTHAIEKSDAMLYTPSAKGDKCPNFFGIRVVLDVKDKEECRHVSLRCYMLELIMVIDEEEIMDNNAECINDFNDTLPEANSVGCPPCEANSLENITIFLDSLNRLLEKETDYGMRNT